jgi:hypothetical protein
MALALLGHYLIGITLAYLFLWSTTRLSLPAQHPGVALGYALCTCALPWLIMFPAMGYGFFGARGTSGTRLFTSSLIGHAFYGLGIWLGVCFLMPLLERRSTFPG